MCESAIVAVCVRAREPECAHIREQDRMLVSVSLRNRFSECEGSVQQMHA